jgi:hypothetical protein
MYDLFPPQIAFNASKPKSYDNDDLHISLMPMRGQTLLTLFGGFPNVPNELKGVTFQIFDDEGLIGAGVTNKLGQCAINGLESSNYVIEFNLPVTK